jgi:hypothetical protein
MNLHLGMWYVGIDFPDEPFFFLFQLEKRTRNRICMQQTETHVVLLTLLPLLQYISKDLYHLNKPLKITFDYFQHKADLVRLAIIGQNTERLDKTYMLQRVEHDIL